jgi:hypothetical protein
MVETKGFEMAADFLADVLVNRLNIIEDGQEDLGWYDHPLFHCHFKIAARMNCSPEFCSKYTSQSSNFCKLSRWSSAFVMLPPFLPLRSIDIPCA